MRIRLILIAIMIIFGSFIMCFATGENVKTYKFENDINMSGVISGSSKFFEVGKSWNINSAKLNLIFSKSEVLDADYSIITVFINDTPVHSEKLNHKEEYKKESTIEIPKELIKEGYNEIKIKAYKTISDIVCRDDSNTANWLVIHQGSNVNIDYDYKESPNLLSEYPNVFVNIDNGLKLNTVILVPDNYSSSELSAGMILSSDFGKKIKYENFNFDFRTYSDFKNKDDNIIYIGKEKNTPTEVLGLLTESEKSGLDKKCVVKIVDSQFNKDKKAILIISKDDELLKKGSKLLSSNDLINNLNKESIEIYGNTDVDDLIKEESSSIIYFKDLGYDNIVVKGPFSQEVIMDINIPKNKVAGSKSKIKLDIRYAGNLDFERSLATVYVNDIPVGSKKLSKENSDNDSIELNLPKELHDLNYYQIKVVFNLELLDMACVTRDTDNPWAYISKESFVDFDYKDNSALKFGMYPHPFVQNDKFDDVSIVIPEKLASRELTYIANVVSYMGHTIKYNSGNLNVVKESEFKNSNKDDNLVIIGTPRDNKMIKDINKDLNLKFREDYIGFESNDKIKFVGDYPSEVASIQLIDSPYSKDKSAIVIASTNISDLSLSSKFLSDLSLTKNLKGDTVVIGRNGYVEDLDYREVKEKVKEDKNKDRKISSNGKIFILVSVFLLFTLVFSIVLLVLKYRK